MFCKKCGTEVSATANVCSNCGERLRTPTGGSSIKVESHLAGAILVTLFCCLPLGIVSIVNASRVSGFLAAGNIKAAKEASDNAAKWMWWGFGLGIVGTIIYFFIQVAAAA